MNTNCPWLSTIIFVFKTIQAFQVFDFDDK